MLVVTFALTVYIHFDELDLNKTYRTPLFLFRNFVFIFMGLMIGYKERNRGLVHGVLIAIIFMLIGLVISFLSIDKASVEYLEYLINLVISGLGGVVGVNIPKNSKSRR